MFCVPSLFFFFRHLLVTFWVVFFQIISVGSHSVVHIHTCEENPQVRYLVLLWEENLGFFFLIHQFHAFTCCDAQCK